MVKKSIDVDTYESKITVRDMTGKTHKKLLRPRRHINYSAMGDRETMLIDVTTDVIINDLQQLRRQGCSSEDITETRASLLKVNEIFDKWGYLLDATRTMKNSIARNMIKDAQDARKEEKRRKETAVVKRVQIEEISSGRWTKKAVSKKEDKE